MTARFTAASATDTLQTPLSKYDRQLAMAEIGPSGQALLRKSAALVAGVGGLGCTVANTLAAAGIGRLVLVDRDQVAESNLNRQLLYGPEDLGKPKVLQAAMELRRRNPDVVVDTILGDVADQATKAAMAGVQVVVDALDSFSARRLLNRLAHGADVPLVHGAAAGFEGRVMTVVPGETPCLECLLGHADDVHQTPIIGATASLVGCAQSIEVIKLLVSDNAVLRGQLMVIDARRWQVRKLEAQARPGCSHCCEEEPCH